MGDEEDGIMGYNGGTVLAMSGKRCVAVASDMRFGLRNQTVGTAFPKVFREGERCFVAAAGLATDVQTLFQRVRHRSNTYRLREEREMRPNVLAAMVSSLLYEHRFGPYFVEPLIAGLGDDDNDTPFLAGLDLLGAPVYAPDFVAAGTGVDGLLGICESLWRPELEADDLFEVVSQCLLAGLDRDAMSGWGAVVHVLTPTEVTTRYLKARQD